MKTPPSKPLTESELDFLNDLLGSGDDDDAIACVSELDGFLTAVVSGPNLIQPSQWLPELLGASTQEPLWESEADMQRFMSLVMQHMNSIVSSLMDRPENYVPLFKRDAQSDELVIIVEEWCFGYMRGVDLGAWPILPDEIDTLLFTIALHGREENFILLDRLSNEEHQQSALQIGSAVLKMHQYFLAQRTPPASDSSATVRTGPKTGRNDPCPCGSGKKFKKCCLH